MFGLLFLTKELLNQIKSYFLGCSESQLQSSCIALERYVMGRIYTHAMFPNGDGDILRDQ